MRLLPLVVMIALVTAVVVTEGSQIASSSNSNQRRAFYILFAGNIDSEDFPGTACSGFDCSLYDVYIVQPESINATHIQKLKNLHPVDKPPVILGYFDSLHVPIRSGCAKGHSMGDATGKKCGEVPGYKCNNTEGHWLEDVRGSIPAEFGVRDVSRNLSTVCSYPGLADFIVSNRSLTNVAELIVNTVNRLDLHGMYLDNSLSSELFASAIAPMFKDHQYDADGDGVAESYDAVVAQYTSYRPALTAVLRAKLGQNRTLIGNTAGALSDPSFSGITIEMEACVASSQACVDAVEGQAVVSRSAGLEPLGVFWLTHSEAMPPAEQCRLVRQWQQRFAWMRAGTDFFDRSHIVCNGTGV